MLFLAKPIYAISFTHAQSTPLALVKGKNVTFTKCLPKMCETKSQPFSTLCHCVKNAKFSLAQSFFVKSVLYMHKTYLIKTLISRIYCQNVKLIT